MKSHILAALAGIAAALAATPALADATTDDIHCYIIFAQMGASQDATARTAGVIGGLYYMGRLDGRVPDLDLESNILTELPKMTGNLFAAEAARCGTEMKARGAAAQILGKDLQQKGAALTQQENSK